MFQYRCKRQGGDLDALARKVEVAARRRGLLITAPESVKATLLRAGECCIRGGAADAMSASRQVNVSVSDPMPGALLKGATQYQRLAKILRCWHNGAMLADEVDVLMSPMRSELNFPLGKDKLLHLGRTRWRIAMAILDHALKALAAGVECRAVQRSPHLTLVAEAWYRGSGAAKETARGLMRQLGTTEFDHVLGDADVDRDDVAAFLSGDDSARTAAATPATLQGPLLVLIRRWLHWLAPHCLAKVNRVSYGLLDRTLPALTRSGPTGAERDDEDDDDASAASVLAVPFLAKDVPARQSEFSHPDVVIGLTYLAFRHSGLRPRDVLGLLRHLSHSFAEDAGPPKSARPTKPSKVSLERAARPVPVCRRWISSSSRTPRWCLPFTVASTGRCRPSTTSSIGSRSPRPSCPRAPRNSATTPYFPCVSASLARRTTSCRRRSAFTMSQRTPRESCVLPATKKSST